MISGCAGEVQCKNVSSREMKQYSVDELLVVLRFGEPTFPALVPVGKVQNGANALSSQALLIHNILST